LASLWKVTVSLHPSKTVKMARKLSPTLPLIIVTLETNLLQQQKEKMNKK